MFFGSSQWRISSRMKPQGSQPQDANNVFFIPVIAISVRSTFYSAKSWNFCKSERLVWRFKQFWNNVFRWRQQTLLMVRSWTDKHLDEKQIWWRSVLTFLSRCKAKDIIGPSTCFKTWFFWKHSENQKYTTQRQPSLHPWQSAAPHPSFLIKTKNMAADRKALIDSTTPS